MLNLDGIAASMASIESALYAISNRTLTYESMIIGLAKTYRLQESAADFAPQNASSMCVVKNLDKYPDPDVCATISLCFSHDSHNHCEQRPRVTMLRKELEMQKKQHL